MSRNMFDRKRVVTAVSRIARRSGLSNDASAIAAQKALKIVDMCGERSQNRIYARKIGSALLKGSTSAICMVGGRSCHYRYGKIEFARTVEKYRQFFGQIRPFWEPRSITLLVDGPTQDANDLGLETGWNVETLWSIIPDLSLRLCSAFEKIQTDLCFSNKVRFYRTENASGIPRLKESPDYDESCLESMTIAAEHFVLGEYAADSNTMICSHITENFRWFAKTEAAVLHNPNFEFVRTAV